MELREAIYNRHSVRCFSRAGVEAEKLQRILEDANQAPSAGNLQARDFIVVTDPQRKKALSKAALSQDFIAQAPVVVVVCANIARSASKYGRRGAEAYAVIDAALASQNLMLSCVEEGLGSCYVGAFDEDRVRTILGIPDFVRPIGILPIGYPDESPEITDRVQTDMVTHREKW